MLTSTGAHGIVDVDSLFRLQLFEMGENSMFSVVVILSLNSLSPIQMALCLRAIAVECWMRSSSQLSIVRETFSVVTCHFHIFISFH